jgi:excisionase family DNA binding protein
MTRLMTKREVARQLGVSERTVTRYVLRGYLPALRLSPRAIRFDASAVEEWIRDRGQTSR